jgi:hypothetical protein
VLDISASDVRIRGTTALQRKYMKSSTLILGIVTLVKVLATVGCKISPPLYLMDRCKDRFYGKTEFFPAELITFERAKKKQHLKSKFSLFVR